MVTAGAPDKVKRLFGGNGEHPLPRIAQAYLFFEGSIRQFVLQAETEDEISERVHAIVLALRTALQFIVIELEESDDPQVIFETLNARGQPLLPSDLIRNYVFLEASSNRATSPEHLYVTYWREFDERREAEASASGEDRFWHVMERQGRLLRPRIDLFMFHYLTIKTETDLNIGRLFREFRNWRMRQTDSAETFLADLRQSSARFALLVDPQGNGRTAEFARRLKSLDTSTVYPLLLFLMGLPVEVLPRSDFDGIVECLESYLVRRFVCGLTTKNYNRIFVGLLAKVKRAAEQKSDLQAQVQTELLRSEDHTALWPTDDELRRAWLSKPIYSRSRIDRSAMILRALEEHMRTRKNEPLSLPRGLTVEHLLPQKGDLQDYPYDVPEALEETPERRRARLIHTLGNLTLLTGALNTAVSNGPFSFKRAEIEKSSDLRLNAWMRTDSRSAWSEADIFSRAQDLFSIGVSVWPRPQPGQSEARDRVAGHSGD